MSRREQTRARYPDDEGHVERDGVRVFYESYGSGELTLLLLPTWEVVHSRAWKCQIPYLARHARVVTFDRRGSGRSDRLSKAEPMACDRRETALDALAVLDRTGVPRATVAAWCGAGEELLLAVEHADRVAALVLIAPDLLLTAHPAEEDGPYPFNTEPTTFTGWAKWNRNYWRRDWRGFLEFFFTETFTERHSTKQIEDAIGWGLQTDPETVLRGIDAEWFNDRQQALRLCASLRCPTLVLQGSHDAVVGPARGAAVAAAIPGARLVTLEACGHAPQLRDPVVTNRLIRDFACPPARPARWRRAMARPRRALYVSSPIGLGHARRDVAIAAQLRRLHPGLEIDWLAQPPVTMALEACGEHVHPASAQLASEAVHIQSESVGQYLHCFQAWRRMDEILLANFMVFCDLVREEPYDLWIGDEAWELDYYLHENPELKTAPFVWLTDFVGWLPMPDGGEREAALTADYNAEMIEQIARYPRVRDRAIFVGELDDVVPERFGPGLPDIRTWTETHFDFVGHITGFDPAAGLDRAALGYQPGERVCIVTVGGSGVGEPLLRRAIAACPEARRHVPELRMIVVTGPRIDPARFDAPEGVELRPYLPNLHQHLAACDLAIVQGGLTTTMELTASGRPFLYFPLEQHFEQNRHVRHRLERHRAGRCMRFDDTPPEALAAAVADEIAREVDYRPVPTNGAERAAALIAELI